MESHTDFNDYSEAEQKLITSNVILARLSLANAVSLSAEHLTKTGNECPMWCTGQVGVILENMHPQQVVMLLSIAVRVMSESINGTMNLVDWISEDGNLLEEKDDEQS